MFNDANGEEDAAESRTPYNLTTGHHIMNFRSSKLVLFLLAS